MSFRVVHYINQFFAQIGGEEMAHVAPELREGFVGPGMALNTAWKGEAEIVNTIVCGDSYFAEHEGEAKAQILAWVKEANPDLFIAGPAFNAGRYGYACATICKEVKEQLGIPVLTGMYEPRRGSEKRDPHRGYRQQRRRHEKSRSHHGKSGSQADERRKTGRIR